MAKKKRATWNLSAQAKGRPIRLSQCMIVKNEEANIEAALLWAKGVAFEQIVVDTGSTDRTVEIAERLGAKVYHFEWINDFSAAKNFALSKAKGDWIAFLDADEFLADGEAEKIYIILQNIAPEYNVVRCNIAHLNNEGVPFSINEQDRFFRNLPALRYSGAIHEVLASSGSPALSVMLITDISIMHTGYAPKAYAATQKLKRNLHILQKKHEEDPNDYAIKAYLAESLFASRRVAEAEPLMRDVVENGIHLVSMARRRAYDQLLRMLDNRAAPLDEYQYYLDKALAEFPEQLDFLYFKGCTMSVTGKFEDALQAFQACEALLDNEKLAMDSIIVSKPELLFDGMLTVYRQLNDMPGMVRYSTLILRHDPYREQVLTFLLSCFCSVDGYVENEEQLLFFQKIYSFDNLKDKLFLMKCAKLAGNAGLMELIRQTLTEEEQAWLASE